MSKLLTIGIVNFNSSDFVINTLYCLKKLTKNPYKVIIRDNNSNIKDYLKLKKSIENISYITLYRINKFDYRGSIAHGIALNDITKKIETKYGVIMDADFTFLYKNWDEILINQLDEKHPIIGTQPPIGTKLKKPPDFPLMFGILFNNDIFKEMKVDFKPKDPTKYIDTGFELRKRYLENNYKGKLLIYKNTRVYKKGPFNKIICAEYYLDGYQSIFGSHFGRGSSLGRQKYLNTKQKWLYTLRLFKKIDLGKVFIRARGRREKNKWIKVCRKIVENLDNTI